MALDYKRANIYQRIASLESDATPIIVNNMTNYIQSRG